ncbi:uncharacterized protein BP5553_03824 [Venustampulla echinocandica]|uniref:Zn(2)-C6 fungal-type domain-containing protein n=1 Tax=Venustampulla echinocandica TaxID=2656787 RepID=A0A370TVC0_9HELO|nr:uncharacterized protein BP5553_03824 [Venustampulla echinocandica]RDL39484.1 hypothetical protein BP5553_03824 [Venustampulla echinocandica]
MLASPSQTPESAPEREPNPTAVPVPASKITRGHSCVLCQQRKVRCDRLKPCANCLKAGAECVASTPTLPRRRKRKLNEIDIGAKLRKYEQLLKKHGVKIEEDGGSAAVEELDNSYREDGAQAALNMTVPRPRNAEPGALFTDKENSRYVENTLWENLRDEIQDPNEAIPGSSSSDDEINDSNIYPNAESLLVGHGSSSKNLALLHPPPVHLFMMWQTFLVNVNPLVKMFHAHTVQQTILDASADLENVSRPTEALMFSIYLLAVTSLGNEECETMFGESRAVLLGKYSHAAQQALINAKFLKSLNMATLQAFALYLLGVRRVYNPNSFWVLTGVASRIAQRLGLHRDGSHYKEISVFDAEMRRRTWWQIVFLDGHASKLAGAGFPIWFGKFDTKIPLNISDSDLNPTMKEPPMEKEGATEMIFCSIRYDVAQAMRDVTSRTKGGGNDDANWQVPKGPEFITVKDKAIDELEARFEVKYLRYCDPSIPLHLTVMYLAKSVICTMRIMAHHPRQYPDKGASMPQSEKDMLFRESLKELEIDNLGHNIKVVKGYLWHIESHFQLDAFIYLLSELRYRLTGELVERAWQQVKTSFEYHTNVLTDTKNSLYFAIGNLALKAWRKREDAGLATQGGFQIEPPQFISTLRRQRNISDLPPKTTSDANNELFSRPHRALGYPTDAVGQNTMYQNTVDQFADVNLSFDVVMPDITPVDWEYWQTLMDGDLPAYSDGQIFLN